MLPENIKADLEKRIFEADHPKELVVDVMMACQQAFGYLSNEAVAAAAGMLGMSSLEIEELATFYNFIYREPVGKYVIHVCDSVICWMDGYAGIKDYICSKLGIEPGQTTADGRFTLLTACCLGFCDYSPAMMINKKVYGNLTPEKIDALLDRPDKLDEA